MAEEHRTLVADLIWLLKEHGGNEDADVRSDVGKVKRVIATVVKHLYVPTEKPAPPPEEQRPRRTGVELWNAIGIDFTDATAIHDDLLPAAFTTPTRDMPHAQVNRKGKFYVEDMDYLDDQIDGDMEHRSEPRDEDTDRDYESFQFELSLDPTPELIEANKRLSQSVSDFIDSLPASLKASLPENELSSLVARMIFRKFPLDQLWAALKASEGEIRLERRVGEFIDGLPESLTAAFTEEDLTGIVTHQMSEGVSSEKLRRVLDKIGEVRGVVASPEIIKKRKRIRRRQRS